MKLGLTTTLKNRAATTNKDGRMLNAFAEQKNGVMRAVKRPSLIATFAALSGGTPNGQGMFTISTPTGQTLVGVQGDVLNNSPTPIATRLYFSVQPTNWKLNTSFSPAIVVVARNSFGSVVSSFGGNVTIALSSNPTGATLGGTVTVAASSGVATFSNLTLNRSGNKFRFSAVATGLIGASSSYFTIATSLVFTVQPASGQPNVTFDPVEVTAQDSAGNTDTSYTGNVTVALYSASAAGILSGTLTVAAVGGVASFSNLQISESGSYTLIASGTQVSTAYKPAGVVSNSFILDEVMVFTTQPDNTGPGDTMSAVVVTVRDGAGNTITGFTGNIMISILNNPSGGVLSGTTTVAAVSGVATFSDLSIDAVGEGYTLESASTGLQNVESASFNIGTTYSLTAIDLFNNQIFGFSDSLSMLDGTGGTVALSTTGGSISPATYNGEVIGAIAYNPDTAITSIVINANVAQGFFITITINGTPLDSENAVFDQQGGKSAWGWFSALIPSSGSYTVIFS